MGNHNFNGNIMYQWDMFNSELSNWGNTASSFLQYAWSWLMMTSTSLTHYWQLRFSWSKRKIGTLAILAWERTHKPHCCKSKMLRKQRLQEALVVTGRSRSLQPGQGLGELENHRAWSIAMLENNTFIVKR